MLQQQQKQQASSTYETKAVSSSSAASSGRRRTWAESSVFHGDSLAFGNADSMRTRLVAGKLVAASSVAQRGTSSFHDQPCPAHGIYKDKSGYKYDRQTNSGHTLFLPTVSN